MATAKKYVYFFGKGRAEGRAEQKNLLGGKGANLHEMTTLKIPVPPGFTISTEACIEYVKRGRRFPPQLWAEIEADITKLERAMGKRFGDPKDPLLVSVRSGARISMPGMMDTVLNLGLNDKTIQGLVQRSQNPRFAYDSYRRLLQMFGDVVLGIKKIAFEGLLSEKKRQKGVTADTALSAEDLMDLVEQFKGVIRREAGREFPQDPKEQLRMAIAAVFESWNNKRAIEYRRIYKVPDNWGTAVNIQSMVFGNLGDNSGTGVAFTRDPSTGEKRLYGEFLLNAQGEDVVAGIRTPRPIVAMKKAWPQVYREFEQICRSLEHHYRDMMDIEFTIEDGKLYMLQCRIGKRTAHAAIKIAVDMAKERLIDQKIAVLRVEPWQLEQLLHPTIDPKAKVQKIAKGLSASPGAAVGKAVFTAEEAVEAAERHEKVILVRPETSPEDIAGMVAAQGILTARGGLTSHAAVVARGMGKACVVGCSDILVNEEEGYFEVANLTVRRGDLITIDGSTGNVILGEVALRQPEKLTGEFGTLISWADRFRKIGVRTNADTPRDAQVTRQFGGEGIGLCRTEHMFFEGDRVVAVREMILAKDADERRNALAKLLPMQKQDFKAIFELMDGLPVIIRTLDPPLHEFLPRKDEEIRKVAEGMGVSEKTLKDKVNSLQEFNPMLGHRGCRLGISYPEITEMQARAIFEAACELKKKGKRPFPEIMIPLVGHVKEFQIQRDIVKRVATEVMKAYGVKVRYLIGTMIELPRACIVADQIGAIADFFSFGTNDLTQTAFGFSRDDSGRFLPQYLDEGILQADPFAVLDEEGVGELMRIAIEKGRKAKPKLEIGLCGEHGGEPMSVDLCHRLGLDYVSCSPYRVPIAKLAAAHAVLKKQVKIKEMGEK
ncbi:pyruvate, phosphate dikinase [Candidatus Methylomirabilis limnetica]|uniref:Pyruvate, phosphate dikinase n=1 Tax=Candidatus Methylomirabilis limnetica TaxID=2033718 RepID=A0A2T4U199_9BACT|nr:pyruvate, phosphate dikinase [Candidatus Methylomirabilis limnetica]PTL37147.1 pyruvate, phosphate dikinase [Candidatus Methylomirabilis limnetica]